jgi:DNA modification methylase
MFAANAPSSRSRAPIAIAVQFLGSLPPKQTKSRGPRLAPWRSSLGSDARRGLKDHPTVKPTAMLEDALLDLSDRSDIVIDPFLGSGSTLIAADKTGRVCRGVELDPLYVDVTVRR